MTRSDPGAMHLHSVGCTAEIRQISRQEDNTMSVVAKGAASLMCSVAHRRQITIARVTASSMQAVTQLNPAAAQSGHSLALQLMADAPSIAANRSDYIIAARE